MKELANLRQTYIKDSLNDGKSAFHLVSDVLWSIDVKWLTAGLSSAGLMEVYHLRWNQYSFTCWRFIRWIFFWQNTK